MADVAHKNLTGTDLHEPKGADSATANKVYVSDGAGSGTWQKLTADQLQTTGNPFGAQLLHVLDLVSSGTAAQSLTSSTWNTRRFQTTLTNEIASASLSSNQVSLPAGTYFVQAEASIYLASGLVEYKSKLRLRNVTDSTTVTNILGINNYMITAGGVTNNFGVVVPTAISGRFTIAGTKVFELQNWVNSTGFLGGKELSSGESEVYASMKIWKVA